MIQLYANRKSKEKKKKKRKKKEKKKKQKTLCNRSRLATTTDFEYKMRCHPARLLARDPATLSKICERHWVPRQELRGMTHLYCCKFNPL
jgi:hypothetical protein